jgi:hypothetical protein
MRRNDSTAKNEPRMTSRGRDYLVPDELGILAGCTIMAGDFLLAALRHVWATLDSLKIDGWRNGVRCDDGLVKLTHPSEETR